MNNWIYYICDENPFGVKRVLDKYGFTGEFAPKSIDELPEAVEVMVDKFGTPALNDLMREHPDKKYFGIDDSSDIIIGQNNSPKQEPRNIEAKIGEIEKELASTKTMLKYVLIGLAVIIILKN